jgi:nucleoside-diphosphate-sugar epimerase
MAAPVILVTGASGFLAAHVIDSILKLTDFQIRGTLRNLAKSASILERMSTRDSKRIEFVQVKSLETDSLVEALKGVSFVAHVASPFQVNVKDVESDLLKPAVDGTLNLLRQAAKEDSVKRIAITSSFAAVLDPFKGAAIRPGYVYTEEDWNPATWKQAVDYGGAGSFAYTASKSLVSYKKRQLTGKKCSSTEVTDLL